MKRTILSIAMMTITTAMMAQANVYFTKEISAESLQKVYEALGIPAAGRVAVKISTGESSNSNQLRPALIQAFVNGVDGTLVECNTTYSGSRSTTENHRQSDTPTWLHRGRWLQIRT